MEAFSSKLFSKFAAKNPPKSESKVVKGTPDVIAQYVYQDILLLKTEIKKYNELTGLFASNGLYYKLLKLLEVDHRQELDRLKQKHEYDTKTAAYQRQLLDLYKRNLQDYTSLLEMMKNNYNHGMYESHIVNYRLSSVSDVSSSNDIPSSHRNSVFSSPSPISSVDDLVQPSTSSKEIADKIALSAPDSLLDPISFNLLTDPVITPSGITYEKSYLVEHLTKKGKFDPLTREPLSQNQLYPNLVIKDAVHDYIDSRHQELAGTSAK